MKLPDNFDDVPESDGGFFKPCPGAYVCRVIRVQYQMSKSGRPMLVFDFDIDRGPFAGFYTRDNDDRSDRNLDQRWLRMYQLIDGSSLGRFKKLLKDFERCNEDFTIAAHTDKQTQFFDEQSLLKKKIGLVCDGEEYRYNDRTFMSIRPSKSCSIEKIENGDVPKPRIKGVDGTWRLASEPPPPEPRADRPGDDMEHVADIDIPF